MAPPTKLAAERCAKDGRFSYPPDLQEKVDAYRRARKLVSPHPGCNQAGAVASEMRAREAQGLYRKVCV